MEVDYTEIKNKINALVLAGYTNKDIIDTFDNDIKNKTISKQAIYKYIGEARENKISIVLSKIKAEKNLPDEAKFIVDFLIEWSKHFQKEVDDIFANDKLKKKILALEPYLKNLEKVYNLLERILPKEKSIAKYEERIPIKGINNG